MVRSSRSSNSFSSCHRFTFPAGRTLEGQDEAHHQRNRQLALGRGRNQFLGPVRVGFCGPAPTGTTSSRRGAATSACFLEWASRSSRVNWLWTFAITVSPPRCRAAWAALTMTRVATALEFTETQAYPGRKAVVGNIRIKLFQADWNYAASDPVGIALMRATVQIQ
ncbi:unnamed protein product [Arctogadus glacialis]